MRGPIVIHRSPITSHQAHLTDRRALRFLSQEDQATANDRRALRFLSQEDQATANDRRALEIPEPGESGYRLCLSFFRALLPSSCVVSVSRFFGVCCLL